MEKFETITGTGSAITRTWQNHSYITVSATGSFFGAASFVFFSVFWISNHDVMRKIIITGICSENWEPCTISLSHVQLKTIPCNMCKGKFCVKKLSFFDLQKMRLIARTERKGQCRNGKAEEQLTDSLIWLFLITGQERSQTKDLVRQFSEKWEWI